MQKGLYNYAVMERLKKPRLNSLPKTPRALNLVRAYCPLETKELQAIQQKAGLFISMVDGFYGSTITDSVIAGEYFYCWMEHRYKDEWRRKEAE